MKFRKVFLRMCAMSAPAWLVFRSTMLLSILLLGMGILFIAAARAGAGTYALRETARAIYETVEAILLIGILATAIVEDQSSRR